MSKGFLMDPYQISQDPLWHRWIDGVVILIIGVAAGMVFTQMLLTQEVTTTTEIRRRVQTSPQIESGISTDAPSGMQVDEI